MIASVGRSARRRDAGLRVHRKQSKIAIPVTSLPVPEVVGHAMCGVSGPGTGSPVADRLVDVGQEVGGVGRVEVGGLAVSMTEPPPTET